MGRIALPVEPVGDAAQTRDRGHGHREEEGVERERVRTEMIGQRRGEDEGDRGQSAGDPAAFGGRPVFPALRSRSQRGGG